MLKNDIDQTYMNLDDDDDDEIFVINEYVE